MIRIPSGQVVLLTRLCETVLQLPAPAEPDAYVRGTILSRSRRSAQ